MDHSNETSQQNIPQERGQRKGFCYSNPPTLEPCNVVPQFNHVEGKRVLTMLVMDNVKDLEMRITYHIMKLEISLNH